MKVSQKILEVFEEYLINKGVYIDNPERNEAFDPNLIFGKEYKELEKKITNTIEKEGCYIVADIRTYKAKIKIKNDGIDIKSKQLENYIDKYSME